MRINDIGNDIFNKSKKAYKKPVSVKIEGPVEVETEVNSWENDRQIAHPGEYIVTGIKGEKYPIPSSVFAEYELVDDEALKYSKKMKIINAYKVDSDGEVLTAQGEILEFHPGYYIVMESPTIMWAVEGSIFEESYEFLEEK